MTTVRITSDKHVLVRIWSQAYADENAGKTYEAEIEPATSKLFPGWAVVSGVAKFPPHAFEIVVDNCPYCGGDCVRDGEEGCVRWADCYFHAANFVNGN